LAASPRFTTIDTIAARLAELEVQRIAVEAGTTSQIVSVLTVDGQIETLRERLHASLNHESDEQVVTERILLALDARESTVSDRLHGLRSMYTDAHPVVRQTIEEEKLLGQRRDELRKSVDR
jgi:chromosome segregation ATPase